MTGKEQIEAMYQQDRKKARDDYLESVAEARRLRDVRLARLSGKSEPSAPEGQAK